MATIEERLERAKVAVDAAKEEALLAVQFHETWRPTVADADLQKRVENSFAGNSFHIIRMALRREVFLALMRLWDKDSGTVKVTGLADLLREKAFFDALVRQRTGNLGYGIDVTESMRETLTPKRDEILRLVRKYTDGRKHSSVRDRLTTVRNEILAHRQAHEPTDPLQLQFANEEVEEFYQDTLEIVRLLLTVFVGLAFDIAGDGGNVFRHHAKYFWIAVCGERTEGHPFFKRPRGEQTEGHPE